MIMDELFDFYEEMTGSPCVWPIGPDFADDDYWDSDYEQEDCDDSELS